MEPVLEMFFFSSVSEGWADMVGKGERFLVAKVIGLFWWLSWRLRFRFRPFDGYQKFVHT